MRFQNNLSQIRNNLYKLEKPPDYHGASPVVQTIAHMTIVFQNSPCPISAYLARFGGTFP